MIKLIASDIDGTLVGTDHRISPKNLEAIRYAIKKGVHFTIASGRAYDDITPVYEGTGVHCQVIAVNGAQYYDEYGNVITSCLLDREACLKVCEIFKKENLHFMLFTSKGVVTTMNIDHVKEAFIKRKVAQAGGIYEEVEAYFNANYLPFQTMRYVDDLSDFLTTSVEIYKVEGFDQTKEKIDEVRPMIAEIEGVAYLSSFFNNMEVTNKEAQKGTILMQAIKKMGIQPDEVMVIGDGANDLSMFELFENSVAVENAIDEIKAKAKYIVASDKENGVAEAIYKLIK